MILLLQDFWFKESVWLLLNLSESRFKVNCGYANELQM